MKPCFVRGGLSERVYPWLWRASFVALPWQTRWFQEAFLGSDVWEQGRISVYASMLLLLGVIAMGRGWRFLSWRGVAGSVLFTSLILLGSLRLLVSAQWVAWVLLLGLWVWTLMHTTTREDRERWIVFSLLLPAMFGVAQAFTQMVPASTLLGVSAQDPLTRGVGVIETTTRWLRAYGPFPHPNIFGGWMALGILLTLRSWLEGKRTWFVGASSFLFLSALYLSFSRSAWIACVMGVMALCIIMRKKLLIRANAFFALGIIVLLGSLVAIHPELVLTRLQPTSRLETRSVNERRASLLQGWQMVQEHPFGTGVGNTRLALWRWCQSNACRAPREIPHNVFLLALVELGWARFVIVLSALVWILWRYRPAWRAWAPLATSLFVLAMFDHYLWSLWAGMGLVASTLCVLPCLHTSLLVCSRQKDLP